MGRPPKRTARQGCFPGARADGAASSMPNPPSDLQTEGATTFVQFPHPGGEHGVGPSGRRWWAPADFEHARTFLLAGATYRDTADGSDQLGEVAFWGEWEGAVSAVETLPPGPGLPRRLCAPAESALPGGYEWAPPSIPEQNTDPFVYGDRFRYTFCRQNRDRKLRELGRGSVIVFGSGQGHGFVIDTVFVVAGWIDHTLSTWSTTTAGASSDVHRRMTLAPMYGWEIDEPFRLYLGATPEAPVNGMFSFVPAIPIGERASGFARPAVSVGGLIDPALRMSTAARSGTPAEIAIWWRALAEEVLASDSSLVLATQLQIPTPTASRRTIDRIESKEALDPEWLDIPDDAIFELFRRAQKAEPKSSSEAREFGERIVRLHTELRARGRRPRRPAYPSEPGSVSDLDSPK